MYLPNPFTIPATQFLDYVLTLSFSLYVIVVVGGLGLVFTDHYEWIRMRQMGVIRWVADTCCKVSKLYLGAYTPVLMILLVFYFLLRLVQSSFHSFY